MKQPDLYYVEAIKWRDRPSSVARILHTKFDKTCSAIFMASK